MAAVSSWHLFVAVDDDNDDDDVIGGWNRWSDSIPRRNPVSKLIGVAATGFFPVNGDGTETHLNFKSKMAEYVPQWIDNSQLINPVVINQWETNGNIPARWNRRRRRRWSQCFWRGQEVVEEIMKRSSTSKRPPAMLQCFNFRLFHFLTRRRGGEGGGGGGDLSPSFLCFQWRGGEGGLCGAWRCSRDSLIISDGWKYWNRWGSPKKCNKNMKPM